MGRRYILTRTELVQQACHVSINDENTEGSCQNCGIRQRIFKKEPVNNFLNYLAAASKKFKITPIAHNMKVFIRRLFHFAKNFCQNVSRWKPQVLRTGAKLISITCGDSIRFIDSLNFIQHSSLIKKLTKIK